MILKFTKEQPMNIREFYSKEGELPLDSFPQSGGFTSIFRTIGCIGDSLSSGELESTQPDGSNGYHDYFDISWGQYIAREAGVTVYNFSRGGMTAREFISGWGDSTGAFDKDKAAQCYIAALGVNDLFGQGQKVGCVGDVNLENREGNNRSTFAGCYGELLCRYREIEPKSRIFLMTMPRESSDDAKKMKLKHDHAELLRGIAAKNEFVYVIDLHRYAPIYDEEFKAHFYLGGHMNAGGYLLTAKMVMSYIDYIVRQNPEDFAQAGFIGKGVHSRHAKW